jgi:tyrosyl-tRNA synthetase
VSAPGIEETVEICRTRTVDFFTEEEAIQKLERGRPLRIKLGCDPSSPDLHLGHTIPLGVLRSFQELGHQIIFLVGDFTAMIGDPSGRSKTRPALSREEVQANAQTYVDQVGAVLDVEKCEIRYNSEWMDPMGPADFIRLASQHTVARLLERDDFRKRYREGTPIAVHEFLYPFVQAYDSVALEADIEVGGTDQLFNLLLGREIQKAYGQEPQLVLTFPLLEGTDGVEKMSKSVGNAVGIREPAEEIYGKLMSIPDSLLPRWLELLGEGEQALADGRAALEAGSANPRDVKAALARAIVARLQGDAAAREAEAHFDRVIRQKQAPEEVPEVEIGGVAAEGIDLLEVLQRAGFAASRGEGRRLVQQGGVRLDDSRVGDPGRRLPPGSYLLQVGKRRYARLKLVGG